jgi:serine/threonine protein kinase
VTRSNYRILGLIGTGQFGRVYCAIHRQTGEFVALKDLDQQKFPTHLFLREVRLLLTLKHPNIVSCQGLEYHRQGRYLVMDYCEGGTLRDLLENEGKLDLLTGLKLIEQVLLGLEAAHQQNIIHCDLKPENILLNVTKNGWNARISDFGVARILQELDLPVGLGDLGSPAYMAPERYYGQYSYGSDLYAVGVMLYELVMGDRPFSGIPGEIMHQHLNKPVILPDSVPDCLKFVILSSLQKLASRRFATASEMLQSLREAIAFYQDQANSLSCLTVNDSFFNPEKPEFNVKIKEIKRIERPIIKLAVNNDNIYLGMLDILGSYFYSETELKQNWLVKFPEVLRDWKILDQSILLMSRDYSIFQLNIINESPQIKSLKSYVEPATKRLVSISPDQQLMFVAESLSDYKTTTLTAVSLPDLKFQKNINSNHFPSQIIALDHRYCVAIFVTNKNSIFRFFTRRGLDFYTLNLPICLGKITPSFDDPCRIFALETNDNNIAVIIELKPFKITRIALEFKPHLIIAVKGGFLLTNVEGKVVILAEDGSKKGDFKLEGKITAIASLTEDHLFAATWIEKSSSLLDISISN